MARLHAFAAAVTAGAASALLFFIGAGLGLSLAGTFLALASPLPIYVAGLGWGSLAAGGAGALAVAGATLYGDPLAASVFSVAFVMPAFLLAHLAVAPSAPAAGAQPLEPVWRSASALALALIAVGLVQVAIAALALASGDAGLAGLVRERLAALMVAAYGAAPEDDAAIAAIVDLWDSLVLGAIVAAVMLAHAALGALAQGLVRSAGVPRRPAPAFWRLRLPAWLSVLAVALAAAAFALDMALAERQGPAAFAVHLLTGFLLVLGAGFLLQGLAVLHALTRGIGAQPLVLAGCYMLVLVFQPFGALAFAAVGFVECWAGFRERFGAGMEE